MFAAAVGHRSGRATPSLRDAPQQQSMEIVGRETIYRNRNAVQTNPATSEHAGGDQAILAQAGYEGGGLPVPMGYCINQSVAHRGPAIEPDHVGLGPGLIDEDQLACVQLRLVLAPFHPGLGDVRSILLGGPERLFFSDKPSSFNVCQISPTLAAT